MLVLWAAVQVRAAGDDAWLGGAAPEDAALDCVGVEGDGAADLQLGGGGGGAWGAPAAGVGSKALSTGACRSAPRRPEPGFQRCLPWKISWFEGLARPAGEDARVDD